MKTLSTLSDFATPPAVPISSPLVAFHGSSELKAFYMGRVKAHRDTDTLVRRIGWEQGNAKGTGRGCAVGCTLHSYKHTEYPRLIGIPDHLAYVQDAIFEGLPEHESLEFPTQFLDAIPVGADLSLVWWQFADRLLSRVFTRVNDAEVISACAPAQELVRRASVGDIAPDEEWNNATSAAARAAEAAARAAEAAARAASAASAASAAEAAARAAEAAARAAGAAEAAEAAEAAARAARAAAWAAWAAAEAAASEPEYQVQRDDLLELLRSATVAPAVEMNDVVGGVA